MSNYRRLTCRIVLCFVLFAPMTIHSATVAIPDCPDGLHWVLINYGGGSCGGDWRYARLECIQIKLTGDAK